MVKVGGGADTRRVRALVSTARPLGFIGDKLIIDAAALFAHGKTVHGATRQVFYVERFPAAANAEKFRVRVRLLVSGRQTSQFVAYLPYPV